MCGISGYYGNKFISRKVLLNTLNLMKSRGPDFSKYYTYVKGHKTINLLHSRLSIIDINKRSNQPFVIGNYSIIFNGEIYNFKELRQKLIDKKISFLTSSDTEVLLKYFIEYNEKCLDFFEGMWSFAIYNKHNGELFLARDRFGEKPLFYFKDGQDFYFGSEIKYLKSLCLSKFKINTDKIYRYLNFGYKSLCKDNKTFFDKIYSLNPGEYIKINKSKFLKKKYWDLKEEKKYKIDYSEALEESGRLLQKSIGLRTRSDVPITVCLSGGVDSSVIASYCVKKLNLDIKTFSIIDKDERYNEKRNIKIILNDLKCKNKIININKKGFLNKLSDLVKYHDSPVASLAQYLHSLLMQQVNKDGYKVVLSGTAADEIYSGYYEHFLLNFYHIRKNLPLYKSELKFWKKNILPSIRNPYFRNHKLYVDNKNFREHIYDRYEELGSFLNSPLKNDFKEKKYSLNLYNNRKLNELFCETTPIILQNEDLNAMKYSIENRSPFLDKDLIKFMFSINPSFNIRNSISKNLLRKSSENFVNNKVLFDKSKKGFNCAIDSLINLNDNKFNVSFFNDENISQFIDTKKLLKILRMKKKPNYLSKFLFNVINVKFFFEHNI